MQRGGAGPFQFFADGQMRRPCGRQCAKRQIPRAAGAIFARRLVSVLAVRVIAASPPVSVNAPLRQMLRGHLGKATMSSHPLSDRG
ncbi:hypothetical protein [Roseicyclus sp.]|uniref:hypothetical protein n=1 Tax=Roseicyclus sp. TaxID=1914329 RepID=UPI001BCAFEE4|nr:hypothetical protein [Roseicyclus sp.]